MQPLINLKSFLAVLLILIVPAALLVAYFRNYSSEAPPHEHGGKGMNDGPAMGKGNLSAMKPVADSHDAMAHGSTAGPQGGRTEPAQTVRQPDAPAKTDGGHASMGHGSMAQPSTAESQPQQTRAIPQPGAATASSTPAGAEAMQEGIRAMGRVRDMLGDGRGTEVAFHLLHIGAKDFFLDHAQHLTLGTGQQKRLNQSREQALLDRASANRKIQEAEQQLWKSTANEQPNPAEIETKVREIEKLRADQRLAMIRLVDEAARVLTEEQTKILLGTAAPVLPDMPAAESAHSHKP